MKTATLLLFLSSFLALSLVVGETPATKDIDCKGGYDSWSQCEPLEGHDTHHDSEDEFNIQRGPDGYYVGECFQYKTFHVITPHRGNGNKCSHKDGSKTFRYCDDCSAIPAVYKRLETQGPSRDFRFFVIITGILILLAIVLFFAMCVRKLLSNDNTPQREIPFYPPGTREVPSQAAFGVQAPETNTTQNSGPPSKGVTLEVDRLTDVGV